MGHGITWESDKSDYLFHWFLLWESGGMRSWGLRLSTQAWGGIQTHTHITDIFYYILLYYYSHPHTWAAFFLLYLLYIEVFL